MLLALAGFASGWINVIAGGGSLLTVGALVFMGLPGPVANGTNRIAIIAQSLAAVASFRSRGFSDFRLSATLAAAASLGAFFGAQVGVSLAGVWFNRTVAAVMIAVMVLMASERDKSKSGAVASAKAAAAPERSAKAKNLALGHVLMIGAGFWGGLIQIGVGFLLMPILYRVMGLDLLRVNMHKVFIALVFTTVSFFVFAAKVEIVWEAGAALAAGTALGGWMGAHAAILRGERFIKRALVAVLAVMTVKLLFFP
ncbi:MAG: sulfite exporter TauE/SafE family protein [Parvularculaceae bacterium]|nr:sulfite exporter TauE/SafE family protein [Parvularculaceae bacterium]